MNNPQNPLNLNKFKPAVAPIKTPPNTTKLTNTTTQTPRYVELEKRRATVLANIDNVPSLPSLIMEILKVLNSKASSAADVEAQMKTDQVLTAKILKIANSSYYALSSKVTTVTRAVTTIGFNSLKSIVTSVSVSDTLNNDLTIYGYEKSGLWAHSLACAAIAKLIGQKVYHLSDEQTEELFISGLLHDIGKIVMAPQLEIYKDEIAHYAPELTPYQISLAEAKILGIEHAEVGGLLCKHWNLSETLQNTIANHHTETNDQSSSIVRIADIICHTNKVGFTDDYQWVHKIPQELLDTLGISDTNMERLQGFFKNYIATEVQALIQTMAL